MPPRITRASARQAASQSSSSQASSFATASPAIATPAAGSASVTNQQQQGSHPSISPPNPSSRASPRKRKTRESDVNSSDAQGPPARSVSTSRRSKRQKIFEPKSLESSPKAAPATVATTARSRKGTATRTTMSSFGSAAGPSDVRDEAASPPRKSVRGKKSARDTSTPILPSSGPSCPPKQASGDLEDLDTIMTGTAEAEDGGEHPSSPPLPSGDDNDPDSDRDHDHDDDDSDGHDDDDDDDNEDEDEDDEDDNGEDHLRRYADDGLSDPFGSGFAHPPRGSGLPAALSMLGGMLSMSGMGSRLREILNNLRQKDDVSVQLIALQDLSEILLVSNEDNLSGSFSPDAYVRELVALMQPNEFTGEENPEVMLLACRCLANLMEALPASVANVVYGGAVPVLCQKLLEISFIDLAEQALSTLEKISVEYPSSIVREGGLTACLSYLEFFATSTQRTAVTTAANCCRDIPQDSFPVVRDVMPILLNVLNSSDQRVVEQAALCVSRIVESFKHYPSKLEELIGVDMLKAILRLLLPGSSNHLIGPNLHTQFLRVLAITANDSPRLAAELFKMNVVETLYQILTGVSPPAGTEDIASKLDSVLIMQALIHRPREQILETLNVVCNLLPKEPDNVLAYPFTAKATVSSGAAAIASGASTSTVASRKKPTLNEKRIELLKACKNEVWRFAVILFPTLTDAYSSTVNLDVRLRVLSAQIKMLSNLDTDIIREALKAVPYASFLASILSQQDHPSLVKFALEATELLMSRLDDVYRYQLYREGVINEIERIATTLETNPAPEPASSSAFGAGFLGKKSRDSHDGDTGAESSVDGSDRNSDGNDSVSDNEPNIEDGEVNSQNEQADNDAAPEVEKEEEEDEDDQDDEDDGEDDDVDHDDEDEEEEEGEEESRSHHYSDEDEENDNESVNHEDELLGSPVSSDSSMSNEPPPRRYLTGAPPRAQIAAYAKAFLERHETEKNDKAMRKNATQTLSSLCVLAEELTAFYLKRTATSLPLEHGLDLLKRLAGFFDSDVFESATSAELLASGIVRVLEQVLSNPDEALANAAQSAFLEVFMGHTLKSRPKTATADSPATPFSILVHKLQDLLSRSEHFEVITVHHNTFDGNHSSAASMLAKQIRLRLVADDDSDVPRAFRSIMVSIHAIATFKALEDYLRPRISLSDRSRGMRRDGLSRALAAMAGSGGGGGSLGAAAAAHLADRSPHMFSSRASVPPQAPSAAVPGASKTSGFRQPQPSLQPPPAPSLSLRSSRRSSRLKVTTQPPSSAAAGEAPTTPDQTPKTAGKTALRRSSRRPPPTSADSQQQVKRPPSDEDPLADALECADEKQISDDEEDFSEDNTMDAIVGDIDGDVSENATPDPSAVNLEVVPGGKITARKEDGTRVPTPLQGSPSVAHHSRVSALTAALQGAPATPSSSSAPPRPTSYAAAIQTIPQDWHMEFTLNGKAVPMDSTVYRAVLNAANGRDEHLGRSVWSTIHTVHYRRVPGPKAPEPSGFGSLSEAASNDSESADGGTSQNLLDKNPTTLSILRLLRNLHDLNANLDDIFVADKEASKLHVEPLLQFVNTKLTAKLNRQLEEPLIVASNCLPTWSEDLARFYPFLFPFETRHLFLQSTSFGYARSMARWQNAQVQDESRRDRRDDRPFLGRLQRQKVRISRSKILESAVKVMELYGASQSILEVEYFEEVGTGLGPTLEFYSTVSREFAKRKLRLWRDNDLDDSEFVSNPNGLFPRPLSETDAAGTNGERIMSLFRALGKFVARSMLDSRIIDINFNPIFFRIGDESSGVRPSLGAVKVVDPTLARSLLLIKEFVSVKKDIEADRHLTSAEKAAAVQHITVNNTHIEDLSLDFTMPGYPEIELVSGGAQISVTIDNVEDYIEKVVAKTLGSGVRRQVDAFRKGFSQVFPYSALSAFTPDELVSLFGRIEEDWSLETLMDSIKADHGFNMDSRSVKNLLQVMSELAPAERRDFLQFTTGSPKLPIGGFRSLTPMFTVVCKPSEAPYTSDDYLPSVMTCVNYLKLPDYTSIEVLRKQMFTAIREGQGAFHLS
ncbi:Hect domain containing protein [Niveomyces insectorum RCEF 264]|uniref:HECT-type E3 ubiquitin transferase n=1 Tax=Niveomyces insectorum RCEF 264 TaxID=1081102 RepID=A0A167TDQ0_9HYPO|nr:Hect domain containing protein [Niveomyces insectorum RCEF 264]